MDKSLEIVILAVVVLIIAITIIATLSLVNSGQTLLSAGKTSINSTTKSFSDSEFTRFVGTGTTGSEVINLIHQQWHSNNAVAIIVYTKDKEVAVYDYDGYKSVPLVNMSNTGIFCSGSSSCKITNRDQFICNIDTDSDDTLLQIGYKWVYSGTRTNAVFNNYLLPFIVTKLSAASTVTSNDLVPASGNLKVSTNSGYDLTTTKLKECYINPDAAFTGSVQYNSNDVLSYVTFEQE